MQIFLKRLITLFVKSWCSLFCLVISPEVWAEKGPGVQLSVGGTIRDHLPRPLDIKRSTAFYPALGTARLTTTQYCGDGDVASLGATRPAIDFVSSGSVAFVMGYWVMPEGASDPTPTADNWFPLGTASLAADSGSREDMTNLGHKGSTQKIISLMNDAYQSLASNTGYSMNAEPNPPKFSARFGVLMCKNIQSPSSTAQAFPMAHEVSRTFKSAVLSAIDKAIDDSTNIDQLDKFTVSSDEDGVKIKISGNGVSSVTSDSFFQLAKSIRDAPFPDKAEDVGKYQQEIPQAVRDQLLALHNQFYGRRSCTKADISAVQASGTFKWEAFSLQLTCYALSKFNGQTLDELIKAFLLPVNLPEKKDYEATQDRLAKILTRAALMQQSQIAFQATYNRPKDTCFSSSSGYISKVMGSLPMNVTEGKATHSVTMTHPEPSFAIHEIDTVYSGTMGNYNAIFGMSSEPFADFILTQGKVSTSKSLLSKSYLLRFNVRGIGCSNGPIYCLNAGGLRAQ